MKTPTEKSIESHPISDAKILRNDQKWSGLRWHEDPTCATTRTKLENLRRNLENQEKPKHLDQTVGPMSILPPEELA